MNRKDVKKLLLAVIAVVIVAKIARDIMKARKQKENIPADIFEDFYEEEMNWWDKDLEEGGGAVSMAMKTQLHRLLVPP